MKSKQLAEVPSIAKNFFSNYQQFSEKYHLEMDFDQWLDYMQENKLPKEYLRDLIELFNSFGLQHFLTEKQPKLARKYQNVVRPIINYIRSEYNDANYSWIWAIVDGDLEKVNKFLTKLDEFISSKSLPN
jgi:hypothetical protein